MLPLLLSAATWIGLGIVGVILVILLIFVGIYNGLISKRNRVQDAWAQIDVQLKRRYDLIPNLIETVKGYAKYERGVLTDVTKLRSSIVTGSVDQKLKANDQLSTTLKSIFAVAENYPDLKASQNFQNLQEQLEGTEDKISFVRSSYNDYVLDYRNALQTFPSNLFANAFGFKPTDYFQAEIAAKEPVKVDFSDLNSDDSDSAPVAPQKRGKKSAQSPPAP